MKEVAIYTNLVYGSNDVLWASAHHTEDEAWEEARIAAKKAKDFAEADRIRP